ncbi:MAG TPA: glycosyltransferase family 39 protein [Steroidobacteraceae bacterium]|nr:glycosyltransferase family 39 protein [Steroidobacteraceae bacterium]
MSAAFSPATVTSTLSARQRLTLAALLVVALASALCCVRWGLPDGVTIETSSPWAVDSIAPLGPLNEAYHKFSREGIDDVVYPLFHYIVLAGAFAPYIAVSLLTGRLQNPTAEFPFGATDPASFFAQLTVLANLVSALMAAGCVLAVYLIARELFGTRSALWSALLAVLVPPLTYYGATSNLDVPYLFWMLLAFWQFLRAARLQRVADYALCGVCASLAVATKDQAAGFFIFFPLLVPWLISRDLRSGASRGSALAVFADRRLWIAAASAVATFVLANNLVFGLEGFQRHLKFADDFYAANLAVDARGLLARQPGLATHSAALLVQMVGLPLLALAAAGIWKALRARHSLALLLFFSCIGYYASMIAPSVSHSRYLLGVVLLLIPFAGSAIVAALDAPRQSWRLGGIACLVAALLWQAALLAHLHLMLARDSRYAMERWVRAHVPAGATIESSTQARYLPRLADRYRYAIVGNSFSATRYNLLGTDLTLEALHARAPEYVLVLVHSWVSGDPTRVEEPHIRAYYDALLSGAAGYEVAARFETPASLPYRQITAGTQPTCILLRRRS